MSKCSFCGSDKIKITHKEDYCTECGAVVSEVKLENGWHVGNDHKPRRLGSVIRDSNFDIQRLKRTQRISDSEPTNLRSGIVAVTNYCEKLSLGNSFKRRSLYIYRQAHNKGIIQSIEDYACASIYLACKEKGIRTIAEISKVNNRLRKKVYKAYVKMKGELGITGTIKKPEDFIPRISQRIKSPGLCKLAKKILKDSQLRCSGKNRKAIAAAAVYIACKKKSIKVLQSDVAQYAGVSQSTVGKRKREILNIMEKK